MLVSLNAIVVGLLMRRMRVAGTVIAICSVIAIEGLFI